MENRINVAELLKDCPEGMELDCTMFDNVTFVGVDIRRKEFPIEIRVGIVTKYLTKEGCYHRLDFNPSAKCVIFPKGKTTWEGFHRPFKDGDIVVYDNPHRNNLQVFIFKNKEGNNTLASCYLMLDGDELDLEEGMYYITRLATKEEKEKLFRAIKDNGYKWNPETKTLEKLAKFKVGDRIKSIYNDFQYEIIDITDTHYTLLGVTNKFKYTEPIIGDKYWKLVPSKFDISNLKEFDKVLVRDNNMQEWFISFFSHCNGRERYKYSCINGAAYAQCIPYGQNKKLLGKTDDCCEFYKTWEQ